MTEHIRKVAKKAENAAMALIRVMTNIDGPKTSTRRILGSVVHSIILYGAPIWCKALEFKKYTNILEKAQRRILIRICRAYRTTSTSDLQVIAGILPIDLLVKERLHVYEVGKESKKKAREQLLHRWQQRWAENRETTEWTRKLIPKIGTWINRKHGEIGYFLCQITYCEADDAPEHTVFVCPTERVRVNITLGKQLTPDNLVPTMLQTIEAWNDITNFINKVMSTKEQEERQRQGR